MNRISKNVSAFLCVVMMMVSLLTPAMAAEKQEEIIDLGDGIYAVVTLNEGPMTRAGSTKSGSKSATVYNGTTVIGRATLTATFDISGTSAKAIDAAISGSGQNGWNYDYGTTSMSGNKASGTAYFSLGSVTKSLPLTLTCSPDGTIS